MSSELLIQLAQNGIKESVLATFFGMTPKAVAAVLAKARANGVSIRKYKATDLSVSERIVIMYLEGASPKSIASELDCATQAIYGTLARVRKAGLPLDDHPRGMAQPDEVVLRFKERNAFRLKQEAEQRGIEADTLAQLLMDAILTDSLIDAVLDDGTSEEGQTCH
ncbi:MAG: helix-turn-helix domain-containing protein [Pseudomonadota bacterium]|nr:helix-turn-helix domain-containing protein [Pseudomonadota bacterium]